MDKLVIHDLKISTYIGIYPWEQRILQVLLLTIIIDYDFSECTEEINSTLDYDLLCKEITHYVESNRFNLIETVANKVAELVKTKFKVTRVEIRVNKPHAIKNSHGVSITVLR